MIVKEFSLFIIFKTFASSSGQSSLTKVIVSSFNTGRYLSSCFATALNNWLNIPYVNLNIEENSNYNLEEVFNKLLCLDKRQLINKVESINFRFDSIRDCLTKIKIKNNTWL